MSGRIDAVVSDLDGTLVGTEEANLLAYADAFAEVGVAFDAAAYRAAFGLRFRELLERLAPGTPADVADRIAAAKAARYPQHFDRLIVNDGLVVTLLTLRDAGLPLALATTAARSNAISVLRHTGLDGLFDVVLSGEDVAQGKPDPECYLTASARLGVRADRALVFEDSDVGVEAAAAAGCVVLRVRVGSERSASADRADR